MAAEAVSPEWRTRRLQRAQRWLSYAREQPRTVVAAASILVVVAFVAIFAPVVAPYEPNWQDVRSSLRTPDATHWLGTDHLGRDVLSRLIFGARTSMIAANQAVLMSAAFGVSLGLLAGSSGRRVDGILSRMNDALMTLPGITLALAILAVLGPGLTNAMFAIGVIFIPRFFRVTRAAALDVGTETFIEATVAIGCRRIRTVLRHTLPNIAAPIIVQVSLAFAFAIIAEASLSYLGVGVQPPEASWGGMLTDAYQRLYARHLLWPPSVALVLVVWAFTSVGDWISETLAVGRSYSD